MVQKPQTFHGEPPEIEQEFETRADLESKIAEQLAVSDGIDASDVRAILTENGDVLLDGHVMMQSEVDRAVEIVRSVAGVGQITVRLAVG